MGEGKDGTMSKVRWKDKVARRKRMYCKTGLLPCPNKCIQAVEGIRGTYYVFCLNRKVVCTGQTRIPQTISLPNL